MKKIPMRQCVGCREMKPKKELVRVVKSPEGVISSATPVYISRCRPSGRGMALPEKQPFRS